MSVLVLWSPTRQASFLESSRLKVGWKSNPKLVEERPQPVVRN